MEKALEKQLIKSPKKEPKKPKKIEMSKFNLAMMAIAIVSIGLIVYSVINHMTHPDTYEELEPMMEEAQAFDMKAAELSAQYENIEDQIGEDAYFDTIEDGYEGAAEAQRRMIAEIQETNAKIAEVGGITTFEELQRVRVPAGDKYIEKEVREYFESQGYTATDVNENDDSSVVGSDDDSSIVDGVVDTAVASN